MRRLDLGPRATWIDIGNGDRTSLEQVVVDLKAGADVVDLICEDELNPLLRTLSGGTLVVMHGIGTAADRIATVELDCLVVGQTIVTYHSTPLVGLDWVWEHMEAAPPPDVDPVDILAALYETATRRFIPVMEQLESLADSVSVRALDADSTALADIASLLRDEITLRQALRAQRLALEQLTLPTSPLPAATAPLQASLHIHATLIDDLFTARTILADALNAYRGAVADRTAETTRVLTIYAALILPLSLVAGLWGMNVTGLPLADSPRGFVIVGIMMAIVAAISWFVFRRSGIVSTKLSRGAIDTATRLGQAVLIPVDIVMGRRRDR